MSVSPLLICCLTLSKTPLSKTTLPINSCSASKKSSTKGILFEILILTMNRMLYPVYPTLIPLDTRGYENIEMDGIPDIVFYTSTLPSGIKVNRELDWYN